MIEGDEYDSAFFDKTAKFLKYLPDIAVVGNLEYDHADIYPDMESLRMAFRRFVDLVPRQRAADPRRRQRRSAAAGRGRALHVETFGLAADADWRASDVTPEGDRIAFDLTRAGRARGAVCAAAVRRPQRPECAGGDGGRRMPPA